MSSRASRRAWINLLVSSTALYCVAGAWGQSPRESRERLKEPIFRVAERIEPTNRQPIHPLDPAMTIAQEGLDRIRSQVSDYTCMIVKQERINGELNPAEHMQAEIRNGKVAARQPVQPFSVYLNFLKPDAMHGREVIFVDGHNNGKMVAHEGKGIRAAFGNVWLKPEGILAMQGQRYPITEIGIENLVARLIERGMRDRKNDPQALTTGVRIIEGAKINGRGCQVIEVTHPVKKPYYDFHIARVFIDDQLRVPVRYAAYTWPITAGGKPQLEEAYTYLDLKLNVGLTAQNFDHTKKFRK